MSVKERQLKVPMRLYFWLRVHSLRRAAQHSPNHNEGHHCVSHLQQSSIFMVTKRINKSFLGHLLKGRLAKTRG